jgi:hypothetical protein
MPFKSKRQMRWMFSNKPEMAQKWAKKTNFESLPETVKESYKDLLHKIFHRKDGV